MHRMSGLLTLIFAIAFAAALASCDRPPAAPAPASAPAKGTLLVLCGSSMAEPMQQFARTFGQEYNADVQLDLGGSETLLPKLLAGAKADLFVCHDPFEQKVKDAKLWAGSAVVGALRPVLMVRPGNPKAIASLEDLARLDVKIGIGDPRYSTCGEMFVNQLEKQGLKDQVMTHVALQGRTHAEIANGAILGPLDAVVVWNFIAAMYKDKLELVETGDTYGDVRVTIVGLAVSSNPKLRDAFLESCRSKTVADLFAAHGYTPSMPTIPPATRPE